MKLAKRTYALPPETVAKFEAEVMSGQRSAKIAELIAAWMKERERQALRQSIIEGCRDMNEIYLETAKEWEPADDELWRGLEP
jgi:hypothetical protein